jgi:hypothetical protein
VTKKDVGADPSRSRTPPGQLLVDAKSSSTTRPPGNPPTLEEADTAGREFPRTGLGGLFRAPGTGTVTRPLPITHEDPRHEAIMPDKGTETFGEGVGPTKPGADGMPKPKKEVPNGELRPQPRSTSARKLEKIKRAL